MKFHHLGIACENIDQSIWEVQALYGPATASDIIFDEHQNASVCLLNMSSGMDIELISGERVKGLLARGISYYHICYTVQDIAQETERFKQRGAVVISEPKPAVLFNNRLVVFLSTNNGLVELLEA